ncbi:MAG: hypothetical protein K2X08_07435 [Chlamydiales bacterium]|nr:hypothetical protein [Chlamydiales bacterium]
MINITSLATEIMQQAVETIAQGPNVYLVASVGLAAIACFTTYVYNQRYNRQLNLSARGLANIDLSQNTQLREINLSRNRLADINLRQNTQLREINLSWNRLAAIDLRQNTHLQQLLLWNNQLAAIDLSQNTHLQRLLLRDNRLADIDLSQNTQLRELYLCNNQLAAIDLSQNTQLRYVDFSNNRLTVLHDSIFSLSRECRVIAQLNLFTAEYIAEFQERLRLHRLAHPDQGPTVLFSIHDDVALPDQPVSLETQLALWSQEFETAFPKEEHPELWISRQEAGANLQEHFEGLHSLDSGTKMMVANYLRRLRDIKDYKNGDVGKQNTILRVEQMLQLANKNPAFRQELLKLLQQSLVSCGDRVQLYFDEIEIAWQFHHKELSPETFRDLTIRAERCRQLQLHAEKKAEELGLGDEIETILYYRIHLKNDLHLPISTLNMLYPGASGVSEEMINMARAEISALSDETLLATSPRWQERMKQFHAHQVEEITNHYGELLNDLEDYLALEPREDKDLYLKQKPDLARLIDKAMSLNISIEYSAMADFIDKERQKAIGELESL